MLGPIGSGKSSLMGSLTNLKPKVAEFGPCTLDPILGYIRYYDEKKIKIMEVPGIEFKNNKFPEHEDIKYKHQIKGAEIYLIVLACDDKNLINLINFFLSRKSKFCEEKQMVFLFNKCELMEEKDREGLKKYLQHVNAFGMFVSAFDRQTLEPLVGFLRQRLLPVKE